MVLEMTDFGKFRRLKRHQFSSYSVRFDLCYTNLLRQCFDSTQQALGSIDGALSEALIEIPQDRNYDEILGLKVSKSIAERKQ